MRRSLRVRGLFGDIDLAHWFENAAGDGSSLPPFAVTSEIRRAARDPVLQRMLREVVESLDPTCASRAPFGDEDLIARVHEALERGELVASFRGCPIEAAPPSAATDTLPSRHASLPPKDERTWFEIRVVDEVGDAIPAVDLAVSFEGMKRRLTTGGAGVLRIDPVDASFAEVCPADLDALRTKLAPRWSQPRPRRLPEGPAVFVRELADDIEPVTIENEVPAVLVIAPYYRCHEVEGTHFDFGRSFVRSSALEPLARIVDDVRAAASRKAMVFGHTDRAGGELLNKELSERRAKAVVALLTHDADAWEELFTGSPAGRAWAEVWGTKEVQHCLNALRCGDEDGAALVEDGDAGPATTTAIRRFQRGDYADVPAEQAPLVADGIVGPKTRRELFLAYAKRISRTPLDDSKLATVGGERFVGCGEYNPLATSAKDAQSRRAIVFVFDAAAEPRGLPCKGGDIGPCQGICSPAPSEDEAEASPYRCPIYREVAQRCPCNGGADLCHDLIIQLPLTLQEADESPLVFIVESEDGTIRRARALSTDARAHERGFVEISYPDLPPHHAYRMRCEGGEAAHLVFDYTPYDALARLATGTHGDPKPFLT